MTHYTTNYSAKLRLAAGFVGALLLSCGNISTDGASADGGSVNPDGGSTNPDGGSGPRIVPLPDCGSATDQVLSTDGNGQLVCLPVPPEAVALPSCLERTQALTTDSSALFCDELNTMDAATKTLLDSLTSSEQLILDYGTALTKLGTGAAAPASFVGRTTVAVSGRITSGAMVGIPAATDLCTKDFGIGAHMCTVYELYYSAALLKNLDPATDLSGGWVYMQSWRHAAASPVEASAGLADNCAGYTYTWNGTDTNQWNGTTFVWNANVTGNRVPKFYGNTLCNVSQPIACCK